MLREHCKCGKDKFEFSHFGCVHLNPHSKKWETMFVFWQCEECKDVVAMKSGKWTKAPTIEENP